ncbi:MAG: phospholipase D-like domain-containing protein [Pseudomonadota bacterium]|nr:phospholipase D-like domain-containing protein [Pseudomonadota bacterium]
MSNPESSDGPREGDDCWRLERADRAAVVIDAADYFKLARQAMMRATKQILLIGWDFDTRIHLDRSDDSSDAPTALGPFITWLAKQKPELQIYILKWDVGALKLLARGSTIFRLIRWARHDQIHFKLDGAHATGASHHQKILVVDDAVAFCGGIDMTGSRWDTRKHLHDDSRRKRPFTRRRYPPWHDATMAVDGAAAKALGEFGRYRWEAASGEQLESPAAESDPWPPDLIPNFEEVDVAIARTRGAFGESNEVREIEAAFVSHIRAAKNFIYAESQFFASRVIAEEIAKRLSEEDGPEFVLINPIEAESWLEEEAMGPARSEIVKALKSEDSRGRMRIYTPVTDGDADIYVHAKIMIVDDLLLHIGSANLNNRSMGLDSECDLILDAAIPSNASAAPAIAALRNDLLGEHLGVGPAKVEDVLRSTSSLITTIEQLRGNGRTLKPFDPPEWSSVHRAIAEGEKLDPEGPSDRSELTGDFRKGK